MSSQITHGQLFNEHSLAHILDTCRLISVVASKQKCLCKTQLSTCMHLGRSTYSNLSLLQLILVASTFISLLPKATFTHSTQPNFGPPCTHPPLTHAINTLLAMHGSHLFSLRVQPILILTDPLCSPTP